MYITLGNYWTDYTTFLYPVQKFWFYEWSKHAYNGNGTSFSDNDHS